MTTYEKLWKIQKLENYEQLWKYQFGKGNFERKSRNIRQGAERP